MTSLSFRPVLIIFEDQLVDGSSAEKTQQVETPSPFVRSFALQLFPRPDVQPLFYRSCLVLSLFKKFVLSCRILALPFYRLEAVIAFLGHREKLLNDAVMFRSGTSLTKLAIEPATSLGLLRLHIF